MCTGAWYCNLGITSNGFRFRNKLQLYFLHIPWEWIRRNTPQHYWLGLTYLVVFTYVFLYMLIHWIDEKKCNISSKKLPWITEFRAQSFISLMADLRQDINRVSLFSWCLILEHLLKGIAPIRHWYINPNEKSNKYKSSLLS